MSRLVWCGLVLGLALGACQADPPRIEVAPEVLGRIGLTCTSEADCASGLTCAAGSNFAHTYAGSTCELACELQKPWTCPRGWGCQITIDGPASSLPGHCARIPGW